MIKPAKLQLGDTIGIISPCYELDFGYIENSINQLKQKGFKVKLADNIFKKTYGYAASPEERAQDFNDMINDKEIKMIYFDGGEVCNEILPYVDFEAVKANPKIICSYSDSTTILNAVTSKANLVTFYGSSVRTFDNITDFNLTSFENILMKPESKMFAKNSDWQIINMPNANINICAGELIGGYLANFALMLGGNYLKIEDTKKYILFIEDHKMFSYPIVVSKYFSHIEQSGIFDNVSCLLFGHYSTEESPEIDQILKRIGEKHNIPVVRCEDFGHGENNGIIPIGINAQIDLKKLELSFNENSIK